EQGGTGSQSARPVGDIAQRRAGIRSGTSDADHGSRGPRLSAGCCAMIRFVHRLNIVLAIVAVIAVVAVYSQKHVAELTADEIVRIERAMARQQADLSILKADWAYLNQPTHIQPIVDRHNEVLNLQVAKVAQFGNFA